MGIQHDHWVFKESCVEEGIDTSAGLLEDLLSGYIVPEGVLFYPAQQKKLEEAVEVIRSFVEDLEESGLMNEF